MIFEMGESRPKEAPFWFDPFAAYRVNAEGSVPIRPQEGKALWREYSSLFLHVKKDKAKRPSVIDQLTEFMEEGFVPDTGQRMFRCIGMRTDMKAKVFEWIDTGLDVPANILSDSDVGYDIEENLEKSQEGARSLISAINKGVDKPELYGQVKNQMITNYWHALAEPFRRMVLAFADPAGRETASAAWLDEVIAVGKRTLVQALAEIGDDAKAMRQRLKAERIGFAALNKLKSREED